MSHHRAEVGTRAFRRFYEAHYLEVLAYCRRRVGPSAAEDAAAEVFTAAWRKWPSVPKGEGALPWLYGAARREVLHQWRSAARYRRLVARIGRLGRPAASGPDHVVIHAFEAELARQALLRLRPRDREVLRLALWEELTHAQIGGVLGCSEDAASKRFSRARRRVSDEYRALEKRHARAPSRHEKGGDR
jgi:RNA polymerase sigma-70 factor (ECF subfamily)